MKKRISKGSVLLITTVSIAVIFGVLGGSAAYFNNSLKVIKNEKNYIYRNVEIESRANEIIYDLTFNNPYYYFHPVVDLENDLYKGAINSFIISEKFGGFYAKKQENLVIEDVSNGEKVTINSTFTPDSFIEGDNQVKITINYLFSYLGKDVGTNYEGSYKLRKQTTTNINPELSFETYRLIEFKPFNFKSLIIQNMEEE